MSFTAASSTGTGGSAEVRYTLTRMQPPGWRGFAGRVDDAMLARVAWPASQRPLAFVCGPTQFVETVAELLVACRYPASRVKTERVASVSATCFSSSVMTSMNVARRAAET